MTDNRVMVLVVSILLYSYFSFVIYQYKLPKFTHLSKYYTTYTLLFSSLSYILVQS